AGTVDGDGRREGLLVARRDGRGRLVDLDRVRPGQAAVSGHGKGDVVVGEAAETAVRPDGVQVAIARIDGGVEERRAVAHRVAGVRVADARRLDGGAGGDVGPGGAVVGRAHDAHPDLVRLRLLVAGAVEVSEDIHQCAVRLDDDQVAERGDVGLE